MLPTWCVPIKLYLDTTLLEIDPALTILLVVQSFWSLLIPVLLKDRNSYLAFEGTVLCYGYVDLFSHL